MKANPRPARRHHTVPQFYLRGFADGDRISTVQLPGTRRFVQSVRNASSVTDFYTVAGHQDGDDVVEKALSELESAAAAVFAKIITDRVWPLDQDDRDTLALFIAVQATRVPSQRATMDRMAAQMLRLQVGAGGKLALRRQLESAGTGDVSDAELERTWDLITQPDGAPIRVSSRHFAGQMLHIANSIVTYIAGRPWSLIEFDRRSLITSDAPVGLIAQPDDEPWQGVGYMTALAITLPLTRKLELMMLDPSRVAELGATVDIVRAGALDLRWTGTTALEHTFNDNVVSNAAEWLFHHPGDESFVPPDLPQPDRIKMSFGGPDSFSGDAWFSRATAGT